MAHLKNPMASARKSKFRRDDAGRSDYGRRQKSNEEAQGSKYFATHQPKEAGKRH